MQSFGRSRFKAGWYPDPYTNGSQLRWYDGKVWTEHTYASAAPAISPVAQAQAEATVVTVVRQTPDHAFHFIMTICTGGLWLPVWIVAAIWPRRAKVTTRTVRS
jgi:hypothetical protein